MDEKITLKGYIGRKIFDDARTYNKGYKIYVFYPNNDCSHLVTLNEYGNVSIKGILPDLIEGKEYLFECVVKNDNRYGLSYEVVNMSYDRDEKISIEETAKFLSQLSISSNVIENIIEICPNIIDLIISDKVDEIPLDNIKGLREKRLGRIIEKVNENYRFFDIMTEYSDLGLSMIMVKELYNRYTSIEMIRKHMDENPYECLCQIARVGFKTADARIITKNESLKKSPFRMLECIKYLLKENEEKGNTWISISELHKLAIETTPECIRAFVTVMKNDKSIYIDMDRKRVCFSKTYTCEFEIAYRLIQLSLHKKTYRFDTDKYTKSAEGFELSVKQRVVLPYLKENSICVLSGFAGTGKAQPLDSKILTDTGWSTMGDMKIGTKVYGEDGKLHNVIGVYPQGGKDVYEVVFSDSSKTECCKEHLWTIQKPQDRKTGKTRTLQLEDIMKDNLYQTNSKGDRRWMYYVPMVKPIQYESKDVEVNPYILGVLLGDGAIGDKRGGIGISIYEDDVYDKVNRILNKEEFELVKHGNAETCNYRISDRLFNGKRVNDTTRRTNRMKYKLDKIGILGHYSHTKFIPKEYLYNSTEIRLEVLRGLIDTDGYVDASGYEYVTVSKKLSEDIVFLVQSLGGTATVSEKIPTYTHNGQKKNGSLAYRLYIKMPRDIQIHTSEKHISKFKLGQTDARRTIREINYIGKKECQCIMVDNPTHLYLTDNCIVTHNTTSVKTVVDMLDDYEKTVMLLAPTGRASKVLANMTKKEASTIHRGLKLGSREEYNQENQLTVDFVLCDEASMIDIWLMRKLLRAINPARTTLLFICDPEQLASVGSGNVIQDIIQSKTIPTIFLDEVFRYGEGGLSYIATEIRNGRKFLNDDCSNITNFGKNKDYSFVKTPKESTLAMMMMVYKRLLANGMDRNDIVVLSAYNKGEFGTYNINNIIQSYVNPKIEEDIFTRTVDKITISFRVGDKVIQTENNYKANLYLEDRSQISYNKRGKEERPTTKIFNGDDGIVEKIDGDLLVVNFYGELVEYEKNQLNSLLLGYAISTHKSQGSTYDNAVVVSPVSHKFFTKRNLLYVAVTRARKKVFHIGDVGTVNYALKQSENVLRNTFLYDLLTLPNLEDARLKLESIEEENKR